MAHEALNLADWDFVRNMEMMQKLVSEAMHEAKLEGNEKRLMYLEGISRGVTMCQENYRICLKHELSNKDLNQRYAQSISTEYPSK